MIVYVHHVRIFSLILLGILSANTRAQIPAFPGAEGAGAFATGGRPNATRGGVVYHVTNLEADPAGAIPGSLRYGMKTENFWSMPEDYPLPPHLWFPDLNNPDSYVVVPRIIVFDVGGVIDIGEVDISPQDFTIAGQTAPGGITLYGGEFNPGHRGQWDDPVFDNHPTNNIVLRNFSIRTHDAAEKDGLWLPASNSIADHLSMSWYTDEGVSITDGARDVTVQHSIIGPGWNNPDGDGSQLEGSTPMADISVHHNLYIHNDARNPRLGEKEGPGVELDFRNNVIYNWDQNHAGYSVSGEPSFSNFVNNYYIGGPDNSISNKIFRSGDGLTRLYQSGNRLDLDRDGSADGVEPGWAAFEGPESQQTSAYAVPHGVTQTADEALDTVINYAGANWWDRHFLDQRSIDQLLTYGQGSVSQTGRVSNTVDQSDVDAVTSTPMQTRPMGWDTDNDGMSDEWEEQRGLDPLVSDWDGDDDLDGYVNLEEYINELAEWPAPAEMVFNHSTNRYAEINNWSITRPSPGEAPTTTHWQPSRFDVAVINSGTVVMDAPGQHAGTIRLGSSSGDSPTLEISNGWLKIEDETVGPGDGSLIIGGDPAATATVNLNGGHLMVEMITKNANGSLNFTGGVLSANAVALDLINDGGVISPGCSAGETYVMGDLTLNSGSLLIEIGGANVEEFDRVVVDGSASLGGTLDVSLMEDFILAPNMIFEVLNISGARTGEFLGLAEGALIGDFGLDLFITYTAGDGNDVALYSSASVAGDFDNDGDVDGHDFITWQRNPNVGTLAQWQNNYVPASTSSSVPEPTTSMLLLASLATVAIRVISIRCPKRCYVNPTETFSSH